MRRAVGPEIAAPSRRHAVARALPSRAGMTRRFTLLLACCFAVAGCHYRSFDHVDASFHLSANARSQYMPVTDAAREYDASAASALDEAGGVYLGELELKGVRQGHGNHEGPHSPAMLKRAAREAAAVGATHFMLVRDEAHTDTERSEGVAVGAGHPMFVATESNQQVVVARYALVRVEPARFEALPPALRPVPLAAPPAGS